MTKKELLDILEEYEENEEIDFGEIDFVYHFRTLEKGGADYGTYRSINNNSGNATN